MLLLYQVLHRLMKYKKSPLHSTMLLLYPDNLAEITLSVGFTFHYASTISSPLWHWTLPCTLLYIPLCFYYINALKELKDLDVALYIPLCFYYILLPWLQMMRENRLYIPLCFYYIENFHRWPCHAFASLHSTMLLLYRNWLYYICNEDRNFTFHYASTISGYEKGILPGIQALHSTMLLLYRKIRLGCAFIMTPLHSTMLLLYPSPDQKNMVDLLLYIPLCFYYIGKDKIHTPFCSGLYIPLCFYYICILLSIGEDKTWLYIPLCFYYIEEAKEKEPEQPELYIPLCFYYIGPVDVGAMQMSFLYIPLCFYYISCCSCSSVIPEIFTFHYASTISIFRNSGRFRTFPLHSTMLLLYQNAYCWLAVIYHSFTFHYASTISMLVDIVITYTPSLHSTMLLLYLCCSASLRACTASLHSTMLLLYPCAEPDWPDKSSLYIPLCFYYIADRDC